jgi:hypothetical protein
MPQLRDDLKPHDQSSVSQTIDWYRNGECRTVTIGGVLVTIRFVGRKGRRGRIAISAPLGAVFRSADADAP